MALKERINDDLKTALLGGNRFEAEVLRGLKAAVLNEEVSSGKRDEGLDDASIEVIVAREVKKRNESKALYEQNGRPELAETEEKEAAVLASYLPAQMSEGEIQAAITDVIAELGASSPQDMGRVIGAVKAKLGNTASGAVVADLVKKTLS